MEAVQRGVSIMSCRVLFIDDDPTWRDLFPDVLKKLNYTVDTAKDAAEARLRLRSAKYDVAVVDACLDPTSISTRESQVICSLISNDYPQTPLVLITGRELLQPKELFAFFVIGVVDFTSKHPFDLVDIQKRIKRVCEGKYPEPRIFISYRHADCKQTAQTLYDCLRDHFGNGQIFMDIYTLEPGVNWEEELREALDTCKVLLALIGDNWLTTTNHKKQSSEKDYVYLEISTALKRRITVIPVRVNGAKMPTSKELPRGLKPLAGLQAVDINNANFVSEVKRLIKAIEIS
jgi:DNA-binding response OmpR family regulator